MEQFSHVFKGGPIASPGFRAPLTKLVDSALQIRKVIRKSEFM